MKIIELLNKIANGEEVPDKIKIHNSLLEKFDFSIGDGTTVPSYSGKEKDNSFTDDVYLHDYLYSQYLNDEVEIIEEDKKIKRIGKLNQVEDKQKLNNYILRDKINEIIDYFNKGD